MSWGVLLWVYPVWDSHVHLFKNKNQKHLLYARHFATYLKYLRKDPTTHVHQWSITLKWDRHEAGKMLPIAIFHIGWKLQPCIITKIEKQIDTTELRVQKQSYWYMDNGFSAKVQKQFCGEIIFLTNVNGTSR